MSDDTTTDFEGHETDWLANSAQGYGYGYTKEQALTAMARFANERDDPLPVTLVEHVGSATLGMGRCEVEHFVSGERVEIDPDDLSELSDKAIITNIAAEKALDNAETIEDLDE